MLKSSVSKMKIDTVLGILLFFNIKMMIGEAELILNSSCQLRSVVGINMMIDDTLMIQ